MKNTLRYATAVALLVFASHVQAQSTPSEAKPGTYIKCENLNVDNYVEFAKALKAEGQYTIDSACIPALVMHIRTKEGKTLTNQQMQQVKSLASSKGLAEFAILANYSDDQFMQDCSEKRTRQ
ncbi:MAG: hypothetical protein RLZZ262_1063 [Bacteroidota bacterium]|jgi:hypothetical protein